MNGQTYFFPASFAQQRLWFLAQLNPGSAFYNIDLAQRWPGAIDESVLQDAINAVVQRHEVLRTIFRFSDSEPKQLVLPSLPVHLRIHDLREMESAERQNEVLRLATENAKEPFDLTSGPLLRTALIKVSEDESVFLLTLHHIIADGWSLTVFGQELSTLYGAFLYGMPSPLPDLPIQYADFALWQRDYLSGATLERLVSYWRSQLAGAPALRLPADRPRPENQSFLGASIRSRIGPELTEELRRLSRHEGVTLFMTMLAAFKILLHRIAGQDDIVIGSPIANRNRPEVEPLIGFFVNALVLRTQLGGRPTFREVLHRVREVTVGAYAHQDLPFEKLVEELHPERAAGVNPVFQVSFQLFSAQQAGEEAVDEEGLIPVERGTSNIDLALDFADAGEVLVCRTEYSTDLFDDLTIRQWLSCYENLLRAITADPECCIEDLPLLSPEEERKLAERSGDAVESVAPHPLRVIAEQTALRPDAVAAVFRGERGDEQLTYAALDEQSGRLAAHLLDGCGVAGKTVAVFLPHSPDVLIVLLAIWKAGAVYLPLNPQDPPERLAHILEDSGAVLAITCEDLASSLPAELPKLLHVRVESGPVESCEPQADSIAYLIYTSGTTGRPKGVMVSHGAIAGHLDCMQRTYPLTTADRTLLKYSLSFDVSLLEMLSPLMAGATLRIVEPGVAPDSARFAEMLAGSGTTVLDVVPSMLEALLEEPKFAECRSLRRIICGGEALRSALLERAAGVFSRQPIQILNMYGPTEATITATCWEWQPGYRSGPVVPIGRPLPSVRAFILDRQLRPVPPSIPGELYLAGDTLAEGYLNRPDLTAEKFVSIPWTPNERMYHTGDLARFLANGDIEFLGRADEQIKIRGYRVELGEIESALADHPSVLQCAVNVREDSRGQRSLAACVVRNSGQYELWPSIGEYFIYDDLMYFAMTSDERRNRAYRSAIERHVRDKVVVDLGTGADAFLARMCADAGARKVYAIEMLGHASEQARQLIAELGLTGRVEVIHGAVTDVQLPELADVCVSELIGTIGSSEGVVTVLNDAYRLLKPGGLMIPQRCLTRIAAGSLPLELWANPRFSDMTRHYANQVFEVTGRPFDVRVCVKNYPSTNVLSESGVFEEMDFSRPGPACSSRRLQLTIKRAGRMDGFVLWINLFPGGEEMIDSLHGRYSWLPVFFPVFYPGMEVSEGDVLDFTCEVTVPSGGWLPDYRVDGELRRVSGGITPFSFFSSREAGALGANPFYQRLFSDESGLSDEQSVQIARWREAYDEIYASSTPVEPGFDTGGWDSSYTGEPLSAEEMEEQVSATVSRIARLGGKRILEIGCGTGLLLFRLAPTCDEYHGIDFSTAALESVRRQLEARPIPSVRLTQATADDLSAIEPQRYDVVVLNSVVQYFPDTAYLLRVIEGAVRSTKPGGFIFIGDVRSRALLETFRSSVELATAPEQTLLSELAERIRERSAAEQELYLHPAFFGQLGLGTAQVDLKQGRFDNELTRFRYDVILQVSRPQPIAATTVPWRGIDGMEMLSSLLREHDALRVTGIPNARVVPHVFAQTRVAAAQSSQTAGGLRREVRTSGIHPDDIRELGAAAGLETLVCWSHDGTPDTFDALFRQPSGAPIADFGSSYTIPLQQWELANEPARVDPAKTAASTLTGYLRGRLPEYMVPSSFIFVEALPLLPNGKVDRVALASLDDEASGRETRTFTPPRTTAEQRLAAIWCEVLGIENIGIHENFFTELGGHSLLATRLMARVRSAFRIDLPLRVLFRSPTIAKLAQEVEEAVLREVDALSDESARSLAKGQVS